MALVAASLFGTNAARAQAPAASDIDLKLFEANEVDRSKGCTVALWQSNRDPDKDKYAYIFFERLGKDHARQPAQIKIGNQAVSLRRVAIGGKNNGYDLYEYQLYKMPGDNQYVVLELKLGELEGEAVEVEAGTMTVVMRGKNVFRASVKGGAGCMTPAAPAPPSRGGEAPVMFRRYQVTAAMVPAAFTQAVQKKYGCDAAFMKTGILGFQMSEESAIWQIPCERFAYQTTAVYALVYLTDPAANLTFLNFQQPKGHPRTNDPGVLMSPAWDAKTRTVTSVSLARGAGDCGVLERHQVTPEGQFRLVEYREKKACDGKAAKPEDYPLVFRAR